MVSLAMIQYVVNFGPALNNVKGLNGDLHVRSSSMHEVC